MPDYKNYAPAASPGPTEGVSYEYVPWRGVTRETMLKYGVRTKVVGETAVAIAYPYGKDALKVRKLDVKSFHAVGPISGAGLFGKERFTPAGFRAITITEGELDALSAYQMLGGKGPVVSVQSSSSAVKDCTVDRDYLNSFEKIILAFDNDAPGQKAVKEVARLFDFNKVYHLKMDLKDANEFMSQSREAEFVKAWWNASKFMPSGIVSKFSQYRDILMKRSSPVGKPLPMATLQDMTGGLRTGETYLITALEGVGKTEMMHWIEYDLLDTTTDKVAMIHMEEKQDVTIARLAGYQLQLPAHLPGVVSEEEIAEAFEGLVKDDERLLLFGHDDVDDPDVLLDRIRFLVTACGVKYVCLDHINKAVDGANKEDDKRQALDYLSNRLQNMVVALDFCLLVIAHVNDNGLTRDSRGISKAFDTWIHLTRNMESENEFTRSIIEVMVKKNRFNRLTGPAGKLQFDAKTNTLKELERQELPE